jgi:hypothetical protein
MRFLSPIVIYGLCLVLPSGAAESAPLDLDAVIYGRIAERLLIVLFGGLCLFFGYLLFFRATQAEGDLEAKSGDKFYLRVRNVAPGVFFALFGAGVLVVSLVFQIKLPGPGGPVSASLYTSSGVRLGLPVPNSTDEDEIKRRVAAISALVTFYRDQADRAAEGAERNALQRALEIVDSLRGDLVDAVFDEGAYAFYQEISVRRSGNDPSAVTSLGADARRRFVAIDELFSYGSLLERNDAP